MLSAGKNITTPADVLSKIHLEQAFSVIVNPNNSVAEKIRQLREVKAIDPQAYRKQKTSLPYMVAGCFHPMHRLKDNFSFIEHLIVDIDHIQNSEKNLNFLKKRLTDNPAVAMLFESPGGDGLKVIFNLSERIYDPAYYKVFYKKFVWQFAQEYQIEPYVDFKTHDVTRCCFFSHDAQAYYNFMAVNIHPAKFVSEQEFFSLRNVRELEKEINTTQQELKTEKGLPPFEEKSAIDDVVLLQIKQKLNPNYKVPVKKRIYEPPQIEEVMENINNTLENHQIKLVEAKAIHFGKQLKMKCGTYTAEVNLFYGKKGYSVVKTTKSGTTPQLTELCYQLLTDLLV